jgi:hypothetical protein
VNIILDLFKKKGTILKIKMGKKKKSDKKEHKKKKDRSRLVNSEEKSYRIVCILKKIL